MKTKSLSTSSILGFALILGMLRMPAKAQSTAISPNTIDPVSMHSTGPQRSRHQDADAEDTSDLEQQAREVYAQLPLHFIENQGQSDKRVAYYARQGGANVYFTAEEMVMPLPSPSKGASQGEEGIVLRLRFLDSNPNVQILGNQEQDARFNYFIGDNPSKWRSDVPSYGEVIYGELYPGVDLVYSGRNGSLKYTFFLQPWADVDDIRLAYAGADGLRLADNGDLLVATAAGDLRDTTPYVYQEIGGERVTVDAAFTLYDAQTYGFEVGKYDRRYPLVLDPILHYSTFLGGSSGDYGRSVALADSGAVYVTGRTQGINFPTTSGAYDEQYNDDGGYDVFVSVLTSDLSDLSYSTFLGGSSDDYSYAIGLDSAGNVYLTGGTYGSDFPTTTGAYDENHSGSGDVFVSVLTADLSTLSDSTFLGGSSDDFGYAIALADSGTVYVTGRTESSAFPTTDDVYNGSHNGNYDAFVSALSSDLSTLSRSTFLGGTSDDYGESLALDDAGNAYLTGYTYGSGFPTTTGVYDESHNGSRDVFVSVLTPDLNGLSYSTFLGGDNDDYGYAIALDDASNAYLTGVTSSDDFPTTVGAYDRTHYGSTDAFVSVLTSDLSNLSYSTFLGGYLDDRGYAIALDDAGNAYLTGRTESTDFPTTAGAYDEFFNGDDGYDAFVSMLTSDLSGLSYSTFLGGNGNDYGESIALDDAGHAYLTGYTYGSGFPTTTGAYDASHNGGYDVFVSAISLGGTASIKLNKRVTPTTDVAYHGTVTYTISAFNSGPVSDTNVLFTDTLPTEVDFASWVVSPTNTSLASDEITWSGTVTAGESITWTFRAAHNGDYNDEVKNTAEFSGTTQMGDDEAGFIVQGLPDLGIVKSVTPAIADPGESVTYTITFSNTGDALTTGVIITDHVPISVTNPAADTSGASFSQIGTAPDFIWQVEDLAPGDRGVITITGLLSDSLHGGHTFTNIARIATTSMDSDSDNDSDGAAVTVSDVDLEIEKEVDEPAPQEGWAIFYTLTVTNHGPQNATGVVVSDTLPTGVSYDSDDGDYDHGAWTVGDLGAGGSKTLHITVTVDANTAGQTITNTAAISECRQGDSYLDNNRDGVLIAVSGADLEVEKGVDDCTPHEEGTFTYAITVTNRSSSVASGVVLSDTLPLSVTYDSHSGDGHYDNGVWTVDNLSDGDSKTLQITVTVDADAGGRTITNTARISEASRTDPVVTNNVDEVFVNVQEADALEAPITPSGGGSLTHIDTQGLTITIELPTRAVLDDVILIYTHTPTPTYPLPGEMQFANHAFDLDVYDCPDCTHLPGYDFQRPITITIHYSEADIERLDEESLLLEYWDGAAWVDAACGAGYEYHPKENWLAVEICHLTPFTLLGGERDTAVGGYTEPWGLSASLLGLLLLAAMVFAGAAVRPKR